MADLARAAALAPADASVAAALADARAAAAAAGVDVSSASESASAAVAAGAADESDDEMPPLVDAGAPPGMDAATLAKAREAVRANPDIMKNMGDMMANMSEEQIEAMTAMAPPGMPVRAPASALVLAWLLARARTRLASRSLTALRSLLGLARKSLRRWLARRAACSKTCRPKRWTA